jgi:hypothetical protein
MSHLPLPSAIQAQGIYAAAKYLEDFLAECPPFIPPINILLRCFRVQILAVRDVAADTYDAYEKRFLAQGGAVHRARLKRAFLYAQRLLARGRSHIEVAPGEVADATAVTLLEAEAVLKSACLMQKTQAVERVEKYRYELPLRSALDWFIEQRRFKRS